MIVPCCLRCAAVCMYPQSSMHFGVRLGAECVKGRRTGTAGPGFRGEECVAASDVVLSVLAKAQAKFTRLCTVLGAKRGTACIILLPRKVLIGKQNRVRP